MPTKYVTVRDTSVYYFHAGKTTLPGVVPGFDAGEMTLPKFKPERR